MQDRQFLEGHDGALISSKLYNNNYFADNHVKRNNSKRTIKFVTLLM